MGAGEGEALQLPEVEEAGRGEHCSRAMEVVGEHSRRATAAEAARWMMAAEAGMWEEEEEEGRLTTATGVAEGHAMPVEVEEVVACPRQEEVVQAGTTAGAAAAPRRPGPWEVKQAAGRRPLLEAEVVGPAHGSESAAGVSNQKTREARRICGWPAFPLPA